jgi:hypothetical protein
VSGAVGPALVELRRYRLRAGAYEALAGVFGRHLVAPQEATGMQVLGWFVDAAEPDHFVWLRGFASDDPDARAAALRRFYGGADWAAHRDTANAAMLDSDDVLLLAPVAPGSGFGDAPLPGDSALRVVTCPLHDAPLDRDAAAAVLEILRPPGTRRAVLASAQVPNRFPALPVRDDAVLVWIELADDGGARQRLDGVAAALGAHLDGAPAIATLWPAEGSPVPGIPTASGPPRDD